MGWKNRVNLLFFITFLGGSSASWAQSSGELLWWVTNPTLENVEGEENLSTPAFTGEENPFPYNPEPEPIQQSHQQQIEAIKSAEDLREEQGNRMLQEIRTYMAQNQVILPNTREIEISGYLEGVAGPQVLINGVWREKGETVTVTSRQHSRFSEMVDKLRELSPVLYDSLVEDLSHMELQNKAILLQISRIEPGRIELEDKNGREYTLSY